MEEVEFMIENVQYKDHPSQPCPKCGSNINLIPTELQPNNLPDYIDEYVCSNNSCDYFVHNWDYDSSMIKKSKIPSEAKFDTDIK